MIAFGLVKPGSTLRIPFDTFAAATGAPATLSNFAVGDILIYKDGNTTARGSTTGFTATTSFSTIVGINEAVIDLSSDATADFYKAGSNYVVVISPVTADGQTLAFVAATFTIGYPAAVLNTSIATLTNQTSFTLTDGPAEDDALNGMWAIVHDKASAVQTTWVQILDYTGATKTVTLAATPAATFTIAAIDNISIFGVMPLQPVVTGRQVAVDASNLVAVPSTQKVDLDTIKTNPVVNGGTATFPTNATLASTTNITAGTITTATNLTNAPTAGDLTAAMKTSVTTACTASTPNLNSAYDAAKTAATQASVDAIDDFVDTEVAAILAAVDTEVAAIKAKTDNLPTAVKKNVALAKFMFKMVLAADHVSPATGLTVACQRSIDGGAFANCNTASATEISAGWYYVDLAASDLNGNTIALKFTSATADQRDLLIVTNA